MSPIKKYLNPKNDVAFKHIFGTEKNSDILMAMLNTVLKKRFHTPIQDIEFLSPFQEPDALEKKQSIVDVLCKDADGCQYIIEMQVADTIDFKERAQYYAYKAFVSQMDKGQSYEGLKQVIFLAFCDFSIFPNKRNHKSHHITMDDETGEHDLNMVKFVFVDLMKFENERTTAVQDLPLEEKFYYFLQHAEEMEEEDLKKLIRSDKIIKKAFRELERFSWNKEEIKRYEREDKRIRDNISALLKAKQVGKEEVIESLLSKGVLTPEQAEKTLARLKRE